MEKTGAGDDGAVDVAWQAHRRRVFDVAYRMLGSVSEAEDVVQETYVRLLGADIAAIVDLRAWLITVAGRLCLDQLQSSRARRTSYIGPWLPEPLVRHDDRPASPEDRVTLDESVRMALLVVLETLSPAERTTFVLHDVFRLSFEEVGAVVGRSPAACRQLASRARRRIAAGRDADRFATDGRELRRVAEQFARACESGDVAALLRVLDPKAVGTFDSGGHVAGAPTGPVSGRDRMARVLARSFAGVSATYEVADVNGEPGVVVAVDGRAVAVVALVIRDGRVVHIDAVGNPEKLSHLAPRRR